MVPAVLETWHRCAKEGTATELGSIIADDAVFFSPVVHSPQVGKAITEKYLAAAIHVLLNDSFQYVREIIGERDAMLEFVVELDGIVVNGVDIIKWNDSNQIVEFKVMVRPLKGIDVVRQRMMKALTAE